MLKKRDHSYGVKQGFGTRSDPFISALGWQTRLLRLIFFLPTCVPTVSMRMKFSSLGGRKNWFSTGIHAESTKLDCGRNCNRKWMDTIGLVTMQTWIKHLTVFWVSPGLQNFLKIWRMWTKPYPVRLFEILRYSKLPHGNVYIGKMHSLCNLYLRRCSLTYILRRQHSKIAVLITYITGCPDPQKRWRLPSCFWKTGRHSSTLHLHWFR